MGNYKSKLSAIVENAEITGIKSKSSKNSIGELDFVMIGVGQYECRSNGLFTKEATEVYIDITDGTSTPTFGMFFAYVIDENTILINSLDVVNDNSVAAAFRNLTFKIKQ